MTLIAVKLVLNGLKGLVVDDGGVEPLIKVAVIAKHAMLGDAGGRDRADGFVLAPLNHAGIGRIDENALDAAGLPCSSVLAGGDVHPLEHGGNVGDPGGRAVYAVQIPGENLTDNVGLLLVDSEGISLVVLQLDAAIAVGRTAAHKFAFHDGLQTPALHPAMDGLVLTPSHKEGKLKILLIGGVVRIVHLGGADDIGSGSFESVGDQPLIHGITTGEALHLHDIDAGPFPGEDVRKQALHFGTVRDGFAADDLLVNATDGVMVAGGQVGQNALVAGKRLALAALLCLKVGTGFTKVHTVGAGTGKHQITFLSRIWNKVCWKVEYRVKR